MMVRFTLAASATVKDRFPFLRLTDPDGRVVAAVWAGSDVTASVTQSVTLTGRYQVTSNYGPPEVFGPLPDLILAPGYTWNGEVDQIQAGDQVSGITLFVHRFPSDTTRKYEPVPGEDG